MGRVLVGIGGGIAAFKVCAVISELAKAGHEVRVMLTASAQRFITPLTVATLARHPAYTDDQFWSGQQPRPLHIELGEWAEVLLLAPLTAHTLAKLAHGLADNLLTNTVLASTCPVLLAPAMNTDMWQQAVVQENWRRLVAQPRYHGGDPVAGRLACDRVGPGRMAEPPVLVAHLRSLLHSGGQRDWAGQRVLVSAGSTQEYLDPVRFIGNPATGKMGVALALAAAHRGAAVTLVHGPLTADLQAQAVGMATLAVTTAAEMHQALRTAQVDHPWVIMAAAVADVRPATQSATKLPKSALPAALPLEPVADIVADLARHRALQQRIIGFAAQTGDIVPPAQAKLARKGLDAIVANPVDQPHSGFGSDTNQAVLITAGGERRELPLAPKLELAHHLLDVLKTLPPTAAQTSS